MRLSPCRAGMEEGSPHSPQVQVTMVGRGRRDWHPPHAGQRGERGAYSCDTDSHGALPWHCRQPGDPFVPYFSPTDSSSGGSSHAPSLALKGLGMQAMRKAGSKELYQHPAARHQLTPLKRCARKSGSHWCQTALKRSQGKKHPQTVFPHGIFPQAHANVPHPPWVSAQVQASLGAPIHPCVPKQPGMPKSLAQVPASSPHWSRRDGIFLGITDTSLT